MRRFVLSALVSIPLAGCSLGSDGNNKAVGSAEARISQVPPMVGCIVITAAGNRTVTDSFDVTPGQGATLRLSNLPVGVDTFSALAYATSCGNIGAVQANWWSPTPTVASIAAGQVTSLSLTLEPTGGANVGINFDTDGGAGGDGGVGSDGGAPPDLSGPTDGGKGVNDLSSPSDLSAPIADLALPRG